MRLFIAAKLDEKSEESLHGLLSLLKNKNIKAAFSRDENMHLTMRFLGEMEDEKVFKRVLDDSIVNFENFKISAYRLGFFGDILHLKIEENKTLFSLFESIENELYKIGIEKEARKFSPHITIARKCFDKDFIKTLSIDKITLNVTGLTLFESKRFDGKLCYIPKHSVRFKSV